MKLLMTGSKTEESLCLFQPSTNHHVTPEEIDQNEKVLREKYSFMSECFSSILSPF